MVKAVFGRFMIKNANQIKCECIQRRRLTEKRNWTEVIRNEFVKKAVIAVVSANSKLCCKRKKKTCYKVYYLSIINING